MEEALLKHAIKNVWCAPRQDRQCILKLGRITPFLGSMNRFSVMWDELPLPELKVPFHVYQIGQNTPSNFGLNDKVGEWQRMSDVCNQNNLIVDLYLDSGVQFPRTESWSLRTRNNNLLIAVKVNPRIGNLDENALYIRFYSNVWYGTTNPNEAYVRVGGGAVLSQDHLSTILTDYYTHKNRPDGHAYLFLNGKYINDVTPSKVRNGDVLEWVYDSSIYKVLDFKLRDLLTYRSELDKKQKYLVHQPKAGINGIDYRDDIDFFMYQPVGDQAIFGVYYHKNLEDAVRMVTHADYGLPVQYISAIHKKHPQWGELLDTTVRLQIRKNGQPRPLVFENNRIHELYKLDDTKILRAMVGVNATVPEWQVANLEMSYYTKLMRSEWTDVNADMVEKAYGYNAMSSVLGNTPQIPTGPVGARYIELPEGLKSKSTAYEYDKDGLLLSVWSHTNGPRWYLQDQAKTELVEMISGEGGLGFECYFGQDPVPVDPNYKFRVYRTPQGYPPGKRQYEDITEKGGWEILNGKIEWHSKIYDYLVITDRKFVTYSFDLTYRDHLMKFSLVGRDADGVQRPMEVPPGKIELWMNGRSLIENLDYYVRFPQVVICNKRYLNQVDPFNNRIVVRCSGFCNENLEREPVGDVGFIQHGMLSRNDRFDLRDDKVVRCVVEGAVYDRSELEFSELNSSVKVANVREGAPYQVSTVVVPLRGLERYETELYRKAALEIDERVENYMSIWYPQADIKDVQIIGELYHLYSPFAAKVLYDLLNGVLVTDSGYRPDKQILEELESYRYLLDYDPCVQGVDNRFVNIHVHDRYHVIEVTQFQHAYLARVNRLFLKNRLNLSNFISIKPGS